MALSATSKPRYWWWPFVAGVLVTPLAIYIAVISLGYGHGDGFTDRVLFPLKSVLWPLVGEVPAEYLAYFMQFPVYGAILAAACRVGKLPWASAALIFFHFVCYIAQA